MKGPSKKIKLSEALDLATVLDFRSVVRYRDNLASSRPEQIGVVEKTLIIAFEANSLTSLIYTFFRILEHSAVGRVVGKHAKGMCIIRSQGPKLKHHALKSRSAKKKSQKIDGCQKREFFVSFPKVSLLSSAAAIARKIGVSYYNFQFRSCIRYFSVC